MYDYLRAAAAVPELKVADCLFNSEKIIELARSAADKNVKLLVFPELSVTAYTCSDLFMQTSLIRSAAESLKNIAEKTACFNTVIIIGIPLEVAGRLYNCAAVIYKGDILGFVPKTHIPNYGEFYEKRWFASALDLKADTVRPHRRRFDI